MSTGPAAPHSAPPPSLTQAPLCAPSRSTLSLPFVAMCSARMEGKLPIKLPPSALELSKDDAYAQAALDACRYLHEIGVLDDQVGQTAPPPLCSLSLSQVEQTAPSPLLFHR